MNLTVTAVVAITALLCYQDYHLRQGKDGDLRHLGAASRRSLVQEHQGQLINALRKQAEANPKDARKILLAALRVARRAVRYHRNDPEAWAQYGECLALTGQPFKAYAAVSRAVLLDPTHRYIRGLHAQLSMVVRDGLGYAQSQRILKNITQAEGGNGEGLD